jgi:hypothetical protein
VTRRLVAFAAVCALLAAAGWLYLARAGARPATERPIRALVEPEALARIRSGPHVVFRNTDQGTGAGRIALASLDAPEERFVTELVCDRIDVAGSRGLCLAARRGFFTTYGAHLLDEALAPGPEIPLTGAPSRARVARDAPWAAFTVFETGHSYASASFSTRTTIVDLRTSELLPQLEDWTVLRDGRPFHDVDFNFWGVTFAPGGERFYATLATGGEIFLVEGTIAARELRVLREGVECPSLSPDGRRLAFKSRRTEGGRLLWGLRVLELATGLETALDGETRSVDDQAAWLDDDHVLYALPEAGRRIATGGSDVWMMEARAGAAPRLLIEQASSPAVVR